VNLRFYTAAVSCDLNELVQSLWLGNCRVAAVNDRGQIAATGYRGGIAAEPCLQGVRAAAINAGWQRCLQGQESSNSDQIRLTQRTTQGPAH
jgi:hypothetical protein